MNEQERQKLIEQRRWEQEKRAIRGSIAQHLHQVNKRNNVKNENRYVEAAIIFVGTLVPLYIFFFTPYWIFVFLWGTDLSKVGLSIGILIPYFHGAIFLTSIVSIYRKKSLLDSFFDYFSN